MLVVGVDEAGYGPTLGPLVVAAVAVSIPADARRSLAAADGVLGRVGYADSKKIYNRRKGLAELEALALALLTFARGRPVAKLGDLLPQGALRDVVCAREPWYVNWHLLPLPVTSVSDRVDQKVTQLRGELEDVGARRLLVQMRVVFPGEFNEKVREVGSKNVALVRWVSALLREVGEDDEPKCILMDRLGGRRDYSSLVASLNGASLVRQVDADSYEWGQGARRNVLQVMTGADAHHAVVGAASVVAKYLRELFMKLWNDFWLARRPGLRPTAGYPLDARRFLAAIQEDLRQLRLEPDWYRRCR